MPGSFCLQCIVDVLLVLSTLLIPIFEPVSVVALTMAASVLLATSEAAAAVVPVVLSSVEGAPVPFSPLEALPASIFLRC